MPPPQQQQQGDNSLAAFWISLLLLITAWLIWYFAHAYIVAFVFQIKLLEAKLVYYFTGELASEIEIIQSAVPSMVSFQEMTEVSTVVGDYFRYPMILILVALAFVLYFSNSILKFKKTYTMQRLAEEEQGNWPQITPVIGLGLLDQDIEKGPWAMGITPLDFAKKYKLIKYEPMQVTQDILRHKALPTLGLHKGKAYEVFMMQLGRTWSGVESLDKYSKALFAIFAAKINRDRDPADKLLAQLAASAKEKKMNFTGAQALFDKYKNSKKVVKITKSYSYTLGVMAAMLEGAREDGVFSTAEFLWLKPLNRPLWFMLNSLGRQTPYTEVSGPFAHWLAEKKFGKKIRVPMLNEAVRGLEIAIKEIKYVPEE